MNNIYNTNNINKNTNDNNNRNKINSTDSNNDNNNNNNNNNDNNNNKYILALDTIFGSKLSVRVCKDGNEAEKIKIGRAHV